MEIAAEPKKPAVEIGIKDKVLVTYRTKWYDLLDVPGVVVSANRTAGWPFKIRLEDENGKPINLGHNDDGGEPGSGPFMYCKAENLKMKEKYVPKRLEGIVKNNWKIGERFMLKRGFSILQDEDDEMTGVVEDMAGFEGKEFTICAVVPRLGIDWFLDGQENFFWKKEWMDAVAS